VGRVGFVGRLEAEADVESGGVGRIGAQPDDGEMWRCGREDVPDQRASDPQPACIPGDVKVAQTTDACGLRKGIDIQPAEADETPVDVRGHQFFARAIEPIFTRYPVIAQAPHEPVAVGIGLQDEWVEIVVQQGSRFYLDWHGGMNGGRLIAKQVSMMD
jgi:hypothetical protein